MIKKTAKKNNLHNTSSSYQDLRYWLKQPPEKRVAAVDQLRNQIHGRSARLQRVARIIQRSQS